MNQSMKSDEARSIIIEGLSNISLAKEINLDDNMQKIIGESIQLPLIAIENPSHIHAKGSRKRIKGAKEITIERATKGRLCAFCKQRGDHDKRTCPLLKQVKESGSQCEQQSLTPN